MAVGRVSWFNEYHQLSILPLPARYRSARGMALCSLHSQIPRRRGPIGGARGRGFLRDSPPLGEQVWALHRPALAALSTKGSSALASRRDVRIDRRTTDVACLLLATLSDTFLSRVALQLEVLALRQQLATMKRSSSRPSLRSADRLFCLLLSWLWPACQTPMCRTTLCPSHHMGADNHARLSHKRWTTQIRLVTDWHVRVGHFERLLDNEW